MGNWKKRVVESYGERFVYRRLANESATLTNALISMIEATDINRPVVMRRCKNELMRALADVEVLTDILYDEIFDDETDGLMSAMYEIAEQRYVNELLEGEEARWTRAKYC